MRGPLRPASRASAQSIAMLLLALTVFVNITMPKLGVHVGTVPVYALDLLKIAFLYFAFQSRPRKGKARGRTPIYLAATLIGLILLTEVYATVQYGSPEISVYSIGQVVPAILMCVGIPRCVQTDDDIVRLLKIFCIGIIFSGLLTILVSFTATRGFVFDLLLANQYLNSKDALGQVVQWDVTVRGTSLVGVSNMTGAFLNMMLPTMVVLYRRSSHSQVWRILAIAAITIGIVAIMTTYSRSAYLGFGLLVVAIVAMGTFRGKLLIVSSLAAVGVSVAAIGIDSDYFNFGRIERRMSAAVYDPYAQDIESERIDSYLMAGEFIVEDPTLLVMGEGVYRSVALVDRPDHSVFGRALFAYGLVASLTYCLIMFAALATAVRNMRLARNRQSLLYDLSRALTASLLASVPWFLFTHAIVSNPRATCFYFTFVGLVYAVNRLAIAEAAGWRGGQRPPPPGQGRPTRLQDIAMATRIARSRN